MKSNKELDSILDQVAAEIRDEAIEPAVTDQAARRVWARLAAESPAMLQTATPATHIEGCKDFQSLIPAYLSGSLSEARSLLLVDHTHECVPCRRAMKEARQKNQPSRKQEVARRGFH